MGLGFGFVGFRVVGLGFCWGLGYLGFGISRAYGVAGFGVWAFSGLGFRIHGAFGLEQGLGCLGLGGYN